MQNGMRKLHRKANEHADPCAEREAFFVYAVVRGFFCQRYEEIFHRKTEHGADVRDQNGERSRGRFVQSKLPRGSQNEGREEPETQDADIQEYAAVIIPSLLCNKAVVDIDLLCLKGIKDIQITHDLQKDEKMVVWLVTEHFDGREGNRENVGAEYGDHECLRRLFIKHMALEFGPLVSVLAEMERARQKNADTEEQNDGFRIGHDRM